ncbi:MAG TPA: hypothetical protein VFA56_07075 [Gaiellaceae bacterium]|nr:hypothetical protein [Gaiellaceae bacterium]
MFFAATLCGLKDSRADFPVLTPLDVWNVAISGFTVGTGNIQFSDDFTVAGYIIIKPKAINNVNAPEVFHMGFFALRGVWTIDASGTVTGLLSGGNEEVPLDISFTAKGKDFLSISITGTSTNGPIHMKGAPAVQLTPLTGSWRSTTIKDRVRSFELFDLSPAADVCVHFADPNDIDSCDQTVPATNLYLFAGEGPGYVLPGHVLLSSGGQIGIVVVELLVNKDDGTPAEDGNGRVVIGKLSAKKTLKASTSGTDENGAKVGMDITQ